LSFQKFHILQGQLPHTISEPDCKQRNCWSSLTSSPVHHIANKNNRTLWIMILGYFQRYDIITCLCENW